MDWTSLGLEGRKKYDGLVEDLAKTVMAVLVHISFQQSNMIVEYLL